LTKLRNKNCPQQVLYIIKNKRAIKTKTTEHTTREPEEAEMPLGEAEEDAVEEAEEVDEGEEPEVPEVVEEELEAGSVEVTTYWPFEVD